MRIREDAVVFHDGNGGFIVDWDSPDWPDGRGRMTVRSGEGSGYAIDAIREALAALAQPKELAPPNPRPWSAVSA